MKKYLLPFFVLLLIFPGCKSTRPFAEKKMELTTQPVAVMDVAPKDIDWHDQTTWILGYFNLARLTHYPYSTWYITGYDDYQLKIDAVNKLLEFKKDHITIKIVMGTWCPDSRREVPRFMRVLDTWKFPVESVTFIGVDNEKQSPVGEYVNLDIKLVPTFIIYKNNIEAGRIIENPVSSLEQDMVDILTGRENNK